VVSAAGIPAASVDWGMQTTEESDLAMNRRGVLGRQQRAYLQGMVDQYRVLLWFGAGPDVRPDLETGVVQAAQAEVMFDPVHPPTRLGAWLARLGDGSTLEIRMERTPLPGPHVVYVMPRSRVVVGTGGDGPAHWSAYAGLLAWHQHLGANDLDSLRQGVMPPGLQGRARSAPNRFEVYIFMVMLLMGLFFVVLMPIMWLTSSPPPLSATITLPTTFTAAGWFWGVRPFLRVRRAARSGHVRVLEGPIKRDWTGSKSPSFLIKVAGADIDITDRRPLWDLVADGVEHRLYVTDADVLLAIEPAPPLPGHPFRG